MIPYYRPSYFGLRPPGFFFARKGQESGPSDTLDYTPNSSCPGAQTSTIASPVATNLYQFGQGVAMRGNVGWFNARNSFGTGALHLYSLSGSTWSNTGTSIAEPAGSGLWGESMAMGGENVLAVSDAARSVNYTSDGRVTIYRNDGGWAVEQQITLDIAEGNDFARFGSGVSMYADHLLIAAPGVEDAEGESVGKVYYYQYDGSTWNFVSSFGPGSSAQDLYFGDGLCFAGDTQTCYVSRMNNNATTAEFHVEKWVRSGNTWTQDNASILQPFSGVPAVGSTFWMDSNGDRLLIGSPFDDSAGSNRGKVFLYEGMLSTPTLLSSSTGAVNENRYGLGAALDQGGFNMVIGEPNFDAANSDVGRIHFDTIC